MCLTDRRLALLDFDTPHGFRLDVSSLSSPSFATSYTLGSRGVVDGSISYLYSSLPLSVASNSSEIDLKHLIRGYRHLVELRRPDEPYWWEIWHKGKRVDKKDALLYGRIYLPTSTLEALYLRRITPTRLLRLTAVSDSLLPNGGSILASLQSDYGKYSTEYLYSTDSSMLGARGLYNFDFDPRQGLTGPEPGSEMISASNSPNSATPERQHGRLSAGAEVYFSPLNKSGGMSTAIRFATLPTHTGFPYTMTLTCNPLMGGISSGWAVKAGEDLALCSRFNFNFYSYESAVQVGMELWRRRQLDPSTAWARRMLRPDWAVAKQPEHDDYDGVLKVRADQNWKIGILWEGRVKGLLLSMGAALDLRRKERVMGSVGLEVSYSS